MKYHAEQRSRYQKLWCAGPTRLVTFCRRRFFWGGVNDCFDSRVDLHACANSCLESVTRRNDWTWNVARTQNSRMVQFTDVKRCSTHAFWVWPAANIGWTDISKSQSYTGIFGTCCIHRWLMARIRCMLCQHQSCLLTRIYTNLCWFHFKHYQVVHTSNKSVN